jgi:5-methylcytosine-specific restriction protein A
MGALLMVSTYWLEQERKRRAAEADRKRGSSTSRGYDADWRKLRLVVLSEEPLCRFCGDQGRIVPAEVVDHIRPISEAPELRLERDNLRSLCARCHNSHTATEQGFAKGKKKHAIGPDGLPTDPSHPWFTPKS